MSTQVSLPFDLVTQQIVCSSLILRTATINDSMIQAAAGIDSSKVVHRFSLSHHQVNGTAIVAATELLRICRAAGNVLAVNAAIETIASDVSRTVTIDMQKSTGGGAFATILTATIGISTSTTVRTAVAGAVASAAFVAGDILKFTVAVAGGSGTQAQGLIVTADIEETPA